MLRQGLSATVRQISSSSRTKAIANRSTNSLRDHLEASRKHPQTRNVEPTEQKFFPNRRDGGLPYGRENGRTGEQRNRLQSQQSSRSRDLPRRSKPVPTVHNEEYIYNNFAIPTAAQYGLSIEPIDNCAKILKDANLLSKKQSHHESPHLTRYTEKCTYTIELDNDLLITATGHGKSKSEAEANANLHAICILHDKGLFKSILPGGKYTAATPSTVQAESDAKKDIIDYAARHDCLPIFETRSGRSGLKRSIVRATASIPELSLSGFGRATRASDAQIQACISLKLAAEAHYEKTGDGLLLVKDYTKLTTDSSLKFIKFYSYRRRIRYDTSSAAQAGKGRAGWISTVTLQMPEGSPTGVLGADTTIASASTERKFEGIPMNLKKDSEDTAFLSAALALKKEEPELWMSFVKEMKRGNGDVLQALRPIDIDINNTVVGVMRQTVQNIQSANNTRDVDAEVDTDTVTKGSRYSNTGRQLSMTTLAQKSQDLKDTWDQYQTNDSLSEMRRKRSELPMVQHQDEVMTLVTENDVCVVVGATGSGKTTQLPQLILEERIEAGHGAECNIICTQPRRIAAISVAQRVAVERNEALQESIGYSVRFDSKLPRFGGSINYCTTGILLRQLQDNQDATLDGISHIIIDEVHERDIQIDFLLVILRQLMAERKVNNKPLIKVIMMSATIDTTLFCKYFGAGFASGRCPYIEVPGRTFPVTQHFLDDYYPSLMSTYNRQEASELYSRDSQNYVNRELSNPPDLSSSVSAGEAEQAPVDDDDDDNNNGKAVIDWKSKGVIGDDGEADLAMEKEDTVTPVGLMSVTIAHILKTTTEGSVLVFLPGLQEITALNRILTNTKPLGIDFSQTETYKIYLLHSAIPQMQQEVFEKLETGKRKIILSTNIAETSITIPDVVYVVDSSKHRETQYDQVKRMSSLVSTWTSKSNARQRAGRAGRVQHGHYYTMATKLRYESFEVAPQPEILRTDLQELCLQIKGMGIRDIGAFLREAIEPPAVSSVENSIDHLQALRALDEEENLTPLGRLLSTLPVQPSLGKMVILGAIFKCLDPILILAAASTAKDPFLAPLEKRAEADRTKRNFARGTGSDHVAVINAFQEWRKLRATNQNEAREFAFSNFLHYNTLVNIAQIADQILEIMQKSRLVAESPRPSRGSRTYKTLYGSEEENIYSDSPALQAALATAGFYPNIAVQTGIARLLRTAHENGAQIHLNSLAAPKTSTGARYGPISRESMMPYGTLYTFTQKTRADQNNVNLRGLTRTSALSVILFGGELSTDGAVLQVDGWIPFFARGPQMNVTKDLSQLLNSYLETTFARLGAVTQKRLLGQYRGANTPAFLEQDNTRDPLVAGIVKALDLCSPRMARSDHASSFSGARAGPLASRTGRGDGRSSERSRSSQKKETMDMLADLFR